MNSSTLSPTGFPNVFGQMILDAATWLDFSTEKDRAFAEEATGQVSMEFWGRFIGALDAQAQAAFTKASQADDFQEVEAWRKTYANFAEDAQAEERGRTILEQLNAELPSLLKDAYATFSTSDHA